LDLYICGNKIDDFPLIAGALNDKDVNNLELSSVSPADLVELRVDMFEDIAPSHVEHVFRKAKEKFRKPVIATIRDRREGGVKDLPDRAEVYSLVARHSEIIDIEIGSEEIFKRVRNMAHWKGLLIGSYHNFGYTPEDEALEEIVSKGRESGADMVKIATTAQDRDDLLRLIVLTLRHREHGIITISMGDEGLPSRIFTPLCGSLITYGFVTHPTAPGQLSISELLYIFRRLRIRC
jgi:3-dehydroquinate dehydratase-1